MRRSRYSPRHNLTGQPARETVDWERALTVLEAAVDRGDEDALRLWTALTHTLVAA